MCEAGDTEASKAFEVLVGRLDYAMSSGQWHKVTFEHVASASPHRSALIAASFVFWSKKTKPKRRFDAGSGGR